MHFVTQFTSVTSRKLFLRLDEQLQVIIMNASTEEQPSGSLDTLKWGIIFLCLAGAVAGNYVFGEESVLLRALGVVAAVLIAGLVAMQTVKGRTAFMFAKEARTEVRKVVWPTRQEAIQTTGIVLFVTLLMSILLYFLDAVLFWVVGLVTGLQV